MSYIKDIALAPSGEMKIKWVERRMPVLSLIAERFKKEQPFAGLKVALSVHLEAKTAYLCRVMEMGGAEMYVTGSNPLSTQDDVAAALVSGGMEVFATYDCSMEEYEENLCKVLEVGPNIIIDDGGDLVKLIHEKYPQLIDGIIGGCEETTTGIHRLRPWTGRVSCASPWSWSTRPTASICSITATAPVSPCGTASCAPQT